MSCSVRLEELITLTLLPVDLAHAAAAALSALVSAGPEDAIMKLRVTPWVLPTNGGPDAVAAGAVIAMRAADTPSPVIAFHRFISVVPFCCYHVGKGPFCMNAFFFRASPKAVPKWRGGTAFAGHEGGGKSSREGRR